VNLDFIFISSIGIESLQFQVETFAKSDLKPTCRWAPGKSTVVWFFRNGNMPLILPDEFRWTFGVLLLSGPL
jgi:hypothetical protein